MRIKSFIILLSLFLALPISGSGQVRNLLKKKTSKTSEKAENKIEEGMLNLSNKLFKKSKENENNTNIEVDSLADEGNIINDNDASSKDKGQENNPLLNLLTSGGSNINHEDMYIFDNSLKMLIEGEQTEEQGKMFFTSFFNSKTNDVAVSIETSAKEGNSQEMVEITTILDYANKCGIMLTSQGGQKMAIVTDMEEEGESEINYEEEEEINTIDDYKYNKTGKTKEILGYKCYEYEYTNNLEKGVFWVTDELKFKMDRKALEKSGMPTLLGEGPLEGMVTMEMFYFDEEGQTSHMLVTEVNTRFNKTFSLKGYNVMSVGGEDNN